MDVRNKLRTPLQLDSIQLNFGTISQNHNNLEVVRVPYLTH